MRSGFLIALLLRQFGASGVAGLITAAMIAAVLVIGIAGLSARI